MPIFRYFIFVGAALLALLFVVNQTFSPEPLNQAAQASVAAVNDQPVIRIRSDRKLPERVVLDTNPLTIAPVVKTAAAVAAQPPAGATFSPALAEMSAQSGVRDTFAQLVPDSKSAASAKPAEAKSAETKSAETKSAETKSAEAKPAAPVQRKRKVARSRVAPQYGYGYGRPMMVAQQPHFGLFDTTW